MEKHKYIEYLTKDIIELKTLFRNVAPKLEINLTNMNNLAEEAIEELFSISYPYLLQARVILPYFADHGPGHVLRLANIFQNFAIFKVGFDACQSGDSANFLPMH